MIKEISNQGDSPVEAVGGHTLICLLVPSPGPIEAAEHAVQQVEKNPQ